VFEVQVLGTSAAIPTNTRSPSSQVVTIYDRHHLVDCGEGTQMRLLKHKVKFARLDAIFITHLHGDHVLGLPGLLNSLSLYERNFPLKLFGPSGLKNMLDTVFAQTASYLRFDLEFIPMEDFKPGEVIHKTKAFEVRNLPLDHRIFCRGYRFSEINKKPRFDFYKAKSLEIPNAYFRLLKQGNIIRLPDGREIHPEQVTSPPADAISYSYCSDTRYHEPLVEHIKDSTLLYHEATFLDDMRKRARETHHSTARQAAEIAEKAKVENLLLGHFSARYKDMRRFLDQSRAVFPRTELAKEGYVYNLRKLDFTPTESEPDAEL